MNTDKHGFNLSEGELTHSIIGASFEVLNEIGHGLHEKPYENALVVELGLRKVLVYQPERYPVHYKGVEVGEYVPDLIVSSSVIVDAKVLECITETERGKMINYLRITMLRVGLIINFHKPKLEWERIVL